MRAALLLSISSLFVGCSPPCTPVARMGPPDSVCHQIDAGPLVPNQPFKLIAYGPATIGETCSVSVDAGEITLIGEGTSCFQAATGGAPLRVVPRLACAVPALPAGEYVLNDGARTRFTLGAADSGVEICAF